MFVRTYFALSRKAACLYRTAEEPSRTISYHMTTSRKIHRQAISRDKVRLVLLVSRIIVFMYASRNVLFKMYSNELSTFSITLCLQCAHDAITVLFLLRIPHKDIAFIFSQPRRNCLVAWNTHLFISRTFVSRVLSFSSFRHSAKLGARQQHVHTVCN